MAPGTELRSVYQRHSASPEEDRPPAVAIQPVALPPPPVFGANTQKLGAAAYPQEDIPIVTATVIPNDPPQPSISSIPTLPSPPVAPSSPNPDEDSFAALQARLAALRNL